MNNIKASHIINFAKLQYLKARRPFYFINKMTIDLNSPRELSKIFHFDKKAILGEDNLYEYGHPEDVNDRKRKDAITIATVVRNIQPEVSVEIGTALGVTTSLISTNAPKSKIYTVNILPDDTREKHKGAFVTKLYSKEEIGSYYRKRKLKNIHQVYSDSRIWHPPTKVDFAYVDGCHDRDFVISDTLNIINKMRPGGFIIWHDFSPQHIDRHDWIGDVCGALETLYRRGVLTDYIYHVRDTWTGVYKIPK